MMAKTILVRTMGTYYKNNSPAAGANASRMQGLVWHAKANREPPLDTAWILEHPLHPGAPRVSIGNAASAYNYAADVLAAIGATSIGPKGMPVALVPIPSSKTVRTTMLGGRWPARELAKRLEGKGLGTTCLALVQKQATEELKGKQVPLETLLANLEIVTSPPANAFVVFVDDVVTWGTHIAAADHLLRPNDISGAVAIGANHAHTQDAYEVVRPRIVYERLKFPQAGWNVRVEIDHPQT